MGAIRLIYGEDPNYPSVRHFLGSSTSSCWRRRGRSALGEGDVGDLEPRGNHVSPARYHTVAELDARGASGLLTDFESVDVLTRNIEPVGICSGGEKYVVVLRLIIDAKSGSSDTRARPSNSSAAPMSSNQLSGDSIE